MPIRILVVDDEPDLEFLICEKFRKRIREGSIEFVFAYNGLEALEVLENDERIEVVLTDINMPQMDGLTLLSKLDEPGRPLKSVIVSAYGDMKNIRTAMNRGAYDFVTKPIDFQDLEITVNKTIREVEALKAALKAHDTLVTIQSELETAREMQQSILPKNFDLISKEKNIDIYAEMIPARDVGGDFYDCFWIDNERLGFVIGDVSGKGMPAAIFMAVSRTLLIAIALKGDPPGPCLRHVNDMLSQDNHKCTFVTIFYGVLNTHTGELKYSNGGHNLPYLLSADGKVTALGKPEGVALGVMDGFEYQTQKIVLSRGAGLILYTDGITEAMDIHNIEFSVERLESYLTENSDFLPAESTRGLIDSVRDFTAEAPQSDDMTVLALRYAKS